MFAHTALFTVYSEGIKYKIVFKVAEALILGKNNQKIMNRYISCRYEEKNTF